ncbi:hypothetical protein M9H77_12187 [Catharanthus roseus]|uniref:Uncharacterized protein n=1 Tax=Catharanthus roseus TaxID=4058 RepID=A0ACC0BGT5_CATRO|nr:hypothetical protein M9H77_12187 [Catharanthus roseus]
MDTKNINRIPAGSDFGFRNEVAKKSQNQKYFYRSSHKNRSSIKANKIPTIAENFGEARSEEKKMEKKIYKRGSQLEKEEGKRWFIKVKRLICIYSGPMREEGKALVKQRRGPKSWSNVEGE